MSLVGIVQGVIERYFAISARQAAVQFGYDAVVVGKIIAAFIIIETFESVVLFFRMAVGSQRYFSRSVRIGHNLLGESNSSHFVDGIAAYPAGIGKFGSNYSNPRSQV